MWEGKEQPSEHLEEAAKAGARQYYVAGGYSPFPNIEYGAYKNGFIAGAEWQKEQMPMPEDTVIFQKGIAEGKRLMMEEAVEAKGVICKLSDRVWISPVDEEKFHQEVYVRFVVGQTVKIVIVPIKED